MLDSKERHLRSGKNGKILTFSLVCQRGLTSFFSALPSSPSTSISSKTLSAPMLLPFFFCHFSYILPSFMSFLPAFPPLSSLTFLEWVRPEASSPRVVAMYFFFDLSHLMILCFFTMSVFSSPMMSSMDCSSSRAAALLLRPEPADGCMAASTCASRESTVRSYDM